MGKVIEYSMKGLREIQKVKGCHSCFECRNLSYADGRVDRQVCQARNKSCLNDRKFPYDNTRCKEFVPNEQ